MALDKWLRVIDTLGGLAAASKRLRGGDRPDQGGLATSPGGGGAIGQLEARLAGVVVAALKEAFDRDRARLDLERAQIDAERQRAEEALRLELLRQAGDRALFQSRLIAVISLAVWITSAVLLAALPAIREPLPRVLLGLGWAALIASLAFAFVSHRGVTDWLASGRTNTISTDIPYGVAGAALPWALIVGFGLTAASLVAAL